ncbi:MAG: AAA family ATPase [Clostridia bacterium]|nr:AAA family ATPase [Clostridia bacterium]
MKILSLNIVEFGGLSGRQFDLSEGLNIFEGENEAGKSTVWLFIKFMLYGMPRKGHEDRERSVSWRGHRAVGSMRVRHEGREYRIERSFTESGRSGNERMNIYHHASGEIAFPGKEAGEVFLGVPKEIFENTCGIGQMRLSDLGGKKGADAIRNLLSSADETTDITHIEDKLDKIRVQYRHKNGKGGLLYELNAQINDAKKQWETAIETERRLCLLEEKMKRNQEQSEKNAERLSLVSEQLTQLGTVELLRRFERLREMLAQKSELDRKISELKTSAQKTERELCEADAATLRTLAVNLRTAKLREASQKEALAKMAESRTYDEADAELGERLEAEGGASAILARLKKYSKGFALCLGGGLTLLGIGAIGVIVTPILMAVGALLGVGLLSVSMMARKKRLALAKSFGQTPDTLPATLTRCTEALRARREEGKAQIEAEASYRAAEGLVREIEEALATALRRTLPAAEVELTVDAADREATRISAHLSELRALLANRSALAKTLADEQSALASYDEAALRESLTVDPAALASLDPTRLETERRFLKGQAKTLEDGFRASQIELISVKTNAKDPIELADRHSELCESYARAEEYYETLELALGALSEAAGTMSGNIAPALGRRAGEMMSIISEGRYETLAAGADYTPTLLDADQLTVTADALSAGTRDAAYLSLRIALVSQLFEEDLPPLMLDDALCQIDDVRTARILLLLSKLCEEQFQCLLFTCHTREARICDEKGLHYAKHLL